jgi:hypothetical protein
MSDKSTAPLYIIRTPCIGQLANPQYPYVIKAYGRHTHVYCTASYHILGERIRQELMPCKETSGPDSGNDVLAESVQLTNDCCKTGVSSFGSFISGTTDRMLREFSLFYYITRSIVTSHLILINLRFSLRWESTLCLMGCEAAGRHDIFGGILWHHLHKNEESSFDILLHIYRTTWRRNQGKAVFVQTNGALCHQDALLTSATVVPDPVWKTWRTNCNLTLSQSTRTLSESSLCSHAVKYEHESLGTQKELRITEYLWGQSGQSVRETDSQSVRSASQSVSRNGPMGFRAKNHSTDENKLQLCSRPTVSCQSESQLYGSWSLETLKCGDDSRATGNQEHRVGDD